MSARDSGIVDLSPPFTCSKLRNAHCIYVGAQMSVYFVLFKVNLLLMLQVPMRLRQDCNFSYAGLKNQVRLAIAAKNMYVSLMVL